MSNAIELIPKHDVAIRMATMSDLPFIDALQKKFGKNLGFMADSWLADRIEKGEVIVAKDAGYIISQDRYLKRDELGLIVQLCVDPTKQRGLVGAMLVRAAFERAAYGCRLFCLWCAQDIEANRFWESIGFVPLAYRGGSEKKSRVHIFWQKRIRAGDVKTPWWFPSKTDQGAMRADRIVLPIPAGKHWSDELPVLVINETPVEKQIVEKSKPAKKPKPDKPAKAASVAAVGGIRFGPPPSDVKPLAEKKPREKKKAKADPKLIATAREFRDRWLEQINDGGLLLESQSKYDVTRALPVTPSPLLPSTPAPKLLPAA